MVCRHGDLPFLRQSHLARCRLVRGGGRCLSLGVAAPRRAARSPSRFLEQSRRRSFRSDAARGRARAFVATASGCGMTSRRAKCGKTRSSRARSSSRSRASSIRRKGIRLAREFVKAEFVDRGMIADLNVHLDIGADGMAKPHAHVMLTMRSVDEDRVWPEGPRLESRPSCSNIGAKPGSEHANRRWPNSISTRASITAALKRRASTSNRSTRSVPAAARMAGQGLSNPSGSTSTATLRASNGDKLLAQSRSRARRDHAQPGDLHQPRSGHVRAPAQRWERAVRCA